MNCHICLHFCFCLARCLRGGTRTNDLSFSVKIMLYARTSASQSFPKSSFSSWWAYIPSTTLCRRASWLSKRMNGRYIVTHGNAFNFILFLLLPCSHTSLNYLRDHGKRIKIEEEKITESTPNFGKEREKEEEIRGWEREPAIWIERKRQRDGESKSERWNQ